MNSGVPKQFLLIAGKPVLMHTMQRFFEADHSVEIILALPKSEINTWKELISKHSFSIPHHVAEGGGSRFHSVKNALAFVKEKSLVAVHDGVRPFVSTGLINRSFSEAEQHGNAVPAIPLSDSLRRVEKGRNEIVDRTSFVSIQTPQCFDSEILKQAYNTEYKTIFTDDAGVVEATGEKIHLIEGERENMKITYPVDLIIGEAVLKKNFGK
jgi:2-C-methyl-D-erythritol 4-phosphate cytidylyltransferase